MKVVSIIARLSLFKVLLSLTSASENIESTDVGNAIREQDDTEGDGIISNKSKIMRMR